MMIFKCDSLIGFLGINPGLPIQILFYVLNKNLYSVKYCINTLKIYTVDTYTFNIVMCVASQHHFVYIFVYIEPAVLFYVGDDELFIF